MKKKEKKSIHMTGVDSKKKFDSIEKDNEICLFPYNIQNNRRFN